MKITKRSWFFQLLGLLALVLAFGVMLTGCDVGCLSLIGGLVLGGIIGGALGDVFTGIIVGGVIAFIVLVIISIITPSSGGCSTCKYWDNSSHQGKCNLTGDLYMRNGCSLRPR